MRIVYLMLTCLIACWSADDPFAGFRFSDGKARTLADLAGDGVLLIRACGHCPSAGEKLDKYIAPLSESAEVKHLPFTIVVATPEYEGDDLKEWAKSHKLDRCLVATDTLNSLNVGLKNIWQVASFDAAGKPERRFGFDNGIKEYEAFATSTGTFRLPVEGLEDPKVTALWWEVERRRSQAVPNLLTAAKKKSPQKPQLDKIIAVINADAEKRQKELVDGPASLATIEGLEALLSEYEGLDLKPTRERLKLLTKDKAMKPELESRTMYRKCMEMIANPRVNIQKDGRANLAELAKRYPETVYGRKAATP